MLNGEKIMLINLLGITLFVWGAEDEFSPVRTSAFSRGLQKLAKPLDQEGLATLIRSREVGVSTEATKPLISALEEEREEKEALAERLRLEQEKAEQAEKRCYEEEQKVGITRASLEFAEKRRESLERHLDKAREKAGEAEQDLAEYAKGLSLSVAEAKALLGEVLRFQRENYEIRQKLGQDPDELPASPQRYLAATREVLTLSSKGSAELFDLYPLLREYKTKAK